MDKNIFITTTLPYCNGIMHVGAAFEFILADSLNRYFKSLGYNTYLNIGLDQNGSKILAKAKELNIDVKQYIKDISEIWIESCNKLHIDYDNFYQTSTELHAEKAQKIWNYFVKNNDIYLKEYVGKYCVGCESFKLEKDLDEGKCKDHPTTIITDVSETNYFFNLGKYKENIIKWLNTNPIIPSNKTDELLKFLNDYEEISVSRMKTDNIIGIDVPNDNSQIIFIWAEALMNYIIAADNWIGWNNCKIIQLYGVDNNRFQAQIFQCFLAALNYKHSDKMLIHGTILDSHGRKMSKSEGNVVDPIQQLEKYGLDAVRYYVLAGLNTTSNSSWDEEKLVSLFNSEICGEWGNLVSRVLHLVDTKLNSNTTIEYNQSYVDDINNTIIEINSLWQSLKIKEALQLTNQLVKTGNKYINDTKPWNSDGLSNIDSCLVSLNTLYYLITEVAKLYTHVFPYKNMVEMIKNKKKIILFGKLKSEVK